MRSQILILTIENDIAALVCTNCLEAYWNANFCVSYICVLATDEGLCWYLNTGVAKEA